MGGIIMGSTAFGLSILIVFWGILIVYTIIQTIIYFNRRALYEKLSFDYWFDYLFIDNIVGMAIGVATMLLTCVAILTFLVWFIGNYLQSLI